MNLHFLLLLKKSLKPSDLSDEDLCKHIKGILETWGEEPKEEDTGIGRRRTRERDIRKFLKLVLKYKQLQIGIPDESNHLTKLGYRF